MTKTVFRLWVSGLLLSFARPAMLPAFQQADEAAIKRYSQQAAQAMAEKNADAAVTALEKLAHLTPNVPEVYANLGTVYYAQGRYHQAADALQQALKLNPKLPDAPLVLGICYAELGRAKEAVPMLEPAFHHPPNSEIGRTVGIRLMDAYASLDQHVKALTVTEELLNRYPNDPELLYRASHLYGNRALQTMTRLVKAAPESPWERMAFAEALEGQKRYDLAIVQYRKVVQADPNLPGVHYRLGRALLLNGKDSEQARDEAVKQFQAALASDQRNVHAEYELGELYRQRGQSERAKANLGFRDFSSALTVHGRIVGCSRRGQSHGRRNCFTCTLSFHRPHNLVLCLRYSLTKSGHALRMECGSLLPLSRRKLARSPANPSPRASKLAQSKAASSRRTHYERVPLLG